MPKKQSDNTGENVSTAILLALQLMPIVERGIIFIRDTIRRAQAAGELTPEQEAEYQRHQEAVLASPEAQCEPDPEEDE